jgi:hypothetical protein
LVKGELANKERRRVDIDIDSEDEPSAGEEEA